MSDRIEQGTEKAQVAVDEKLCPKCDQVKPLEDFYPHPQTRDGRHPSCKKCDNAKPRKATAVKINRQRARNRAVADLIRFHEDEFHTLMAIRLAEAEEEAEALAASPVAASAAKAHGHARTGPVRLKPGKRMPGQTADDRIDVARCPDCVRYHDSGHACVRCGQLPNGRIDPELKGGRWVNRGGIQRWETAS